MSWSLAVVDLGGSRSIQALMRTVMSVMVEPDHRMALARQQGSAEAGASARVFSSPFVITFDSSDGAALANSLNLTEVGEEGAVRALQ